MDARQTVSRFDDNKQTGRLVMGQTTPISYFRDNGNGTWGPYFDSRKHIVHTGNGMAVSAHYSRKASK